MDITHCMDIWTLLNAHCEDPIDQHSDPRNIRSYSVHTLTNTHNVPTDFKSVA